MKKNQYILTITFAMLLSTCITYDPAIIYHKNFKPGTHPLLRFDGWYTRDVEYILYGKVKPIFFYRDGSAWVCEEMSGEVSFDEDFKTGLAYSWGNYQVSDSTIELERFSNPGSAGNFNRIILKGIIGKDEINWKLYSFHRDKPDTIDYKVVFQPHAFKPDSGENWTRMKKKYNQ